MVVLLLSDKAASIMAGIKLGIGMGLIVIAMNYVKKVRGGVLAAEELFG